MAELLGIVAILVIAYFFMGDLAMLMSWWVNRNDPKPDPPTSQDPLDKRATVAQRFGGAGSPAVQDGKIELNGVTWSARSLRSDATFDVGDKVRVVEREGLTLVVTALDDT